MGEKPDEKKSTRLDKQSDDEEKEQNACCVVIKCKMPSADGKMTVEMTYEGDPLLASYLLESAQDLIDDEQE